LLWFITPKEAAMASLSDAVAPGGKLINASDEELTLGPLIEVLNPVENGRVPSPLEVVIRFVSRGQPVDLTTLEVSLVKFVPIDITDRVRPYATAAGSTAQRSEHSDWHSSGPDRHVRYGRGTEYQRTNLGSLLICMRGQQTHNRDDNRSKRQEERAS
jgi:hypothetical protein